MQNPMIKLEKVSKTYGVGQHEISVLQEISFEIPEGQMVALLGPSGSGKSTLLNMIGLVDVPSTGQLHLADYDLASKQTNRDELRRELLGYIYQQFHLLPQFNALDNVCLPLVPVKTKFDVAKRGQELLERVGLGHRMNHLPSQLSGGEQQRVAIARSLINSPRILLCDEPTGNLDTNSRDRIVDLLCELKIERGITIVVATHDPEIASRCDSRIEIRDGKLRSVSPVG